MFQLRLAALAVFAALAFAPAGALHAQWQPMRGIYGGDAQSLVASHGSIFACIDDYHVYRTTNAGNSWSPAENGLETLSGIVLSPVDSDVYANVSNGYQSDIYIWQSDSSKWTKKGTLVTTSYAAPLYSDLNFLFAAASSGIQRSTDEGSNWTIVSYNETTSFATIDSFLFAGMEPGIIRSSDNGVHWSLLGSGLQYAYIRALLVHGKEIFAGMDSGVSASTDFGVSWMNIGNGLPNAEVSAMVMLGNEIIAATWQGLYLSSDDGLSWHSPIMGLKQSQIYSICLLGDTIFAATAGEGVFRSTDFGNTWYSFSYGLTPLSISGFAKSGTILYASAGSLWRSDHLGQDWYLAESTVRDLSNNIVLDDRLSSIVSIGSYLVAGSSGILRSIDSGVNWTQMSIPCPKPNDYIESLYVRDNRVFAFTQDFGTFVSTDSGITWLNANNVPGKSKVTSLRVIGDNFFASADDGSYTTNDIYFSSDNGQTWALRDGGISSYLLESMGIVASIDTIVFAEAGLEMFRSSINDTTWTPSALHANGQSIITIDTDLFIVSADGLFVSFDYGDNWTEVDSGLTNKDISALSIDDTFLIASTSPGNDNSPTIWRRPLSQITTNTHRLSFVNTGDTIAFGPTPVGMDSVRVVTVSNTGQAPLTIRPFQVNQQQNAFATSDVSSPVTLDSGETFTFEVIFQPKTAGFHTGTISLTSEAKKVNIVLTGTAYSQAAVYQESDAHSIVTVYPNPSSESATISFTSPESGYAELSIVNLMGEEVARLFAGEMAAGEHSFTWDARASGDACPTGVYQCIVRINGKLQRIGMIVE